MERFNSDHAPSADLTEEEFRAYETAIRDALREAVLSKKHVRWSFDSIELEGSRPETAVVFRFREIRRDPARPLVARAPIWVDDGVHSIGGNRYLDPAPAVAGWLWSSFEAEEFDVREVS